ncbi:MAG: DUF3617 domain-containing protein [Gammaproteobacteria bacterium]|nr:DUF3617 domain-containing protein [Sideroxydans sp.]MBU3902778.1 DUF3617 domain-containing protein [Gammaproteobacteria bacterium]MBU4045441.1 DUF3617 domain-containing protein [Gammaproteobacteria bacterium]MBU4150321.1 DUF3617 domain-containing protein [Gammaproteobacteria bacterium]
MQRLSYLMFTLLVTMHTSLAHAAAGETWEITTKSEMAGMPYAMPETTMTVCQPKNGEPDPKQMMERDGNCKVTDVKHSGSKTTWKMRCDGDGQKMSGSGEISHSKNSYQGKSRMSGTADGEKFDMTATYRGKRIGSSCDTSDPVVVGGKGMEDMNEMMGMAKAQMAAGMAEQCEVGRYKATELMGNQFFGPDAMCAKNRKYACKVISKDAAKKADVYLALVKHDDTSDVSIAAACKIDMKSLTKTICKKVDGNNYEDFEDACPKEYEKFSELEGRSYTSSSRSANMVTDNPVGGAIDGAKKLKGLFGF